MQEAVLHLELKEGIALGGHPDSMRAILKGNPVMVAKMIAHAMDGKQEIAAAVIAGVLSWCQENGINPDNLKNMVKFHE